MDLWARPASPAGTKTTAHAQLRQRQQAALQSQLQQKRQEWAQWEQQVEFEESRRRQRQALEGSARPAPSTPPAGLQPVELQHQLTQAAPPPPIQPQPLPTRGLRQGNQQKFAAFNQIVEQQQQQQAQQLTAIQAGLQQRIAERRRTSGSWLGRSGGSQQQQQKQAQHMQQPQRLAQGGQRWQAQQPVVQQQHQGQDLRAFAASGLQRKVARFAELTRSLQRSQSDRAAGLAWSRQRDRGAAAAQYDASWGQEQVAWVVRSQGGRPGPGQQQQQQAQQQQEEQSVGQLGQWAPARLVQPDGTATGGTDESDLDW